MVGLPTAVVSMIKLSENISSNIPPHSEMRGGAAHCSARIADVIDLLHLMAGTAWSESWSSGKPVVTHPAENLLIKWRSHAGCGFNLSTMCFL